MSENWTREHMVAVYGEAGADAMRKLSDAYAEIESLTSHRKELADAGTRLASRAIEAYYTDEPLSEELRNRLLAAAQEFCRARNSAALDPKAETPKEDHDG